MEMRIKLNIGCLLSCMLMLISGCENSSLVYHPDVAQGSIIRVKDAEQLKLGMSRVQVANMVGTPMNVDPFNQNHWTYWYTNKAAATPLCHTGISLFFKNNKLVKRSVLKNQSCPA